ncbi:branched-chain amino acid ABC transporter substrate-binding protein [Hydromonas duriensis]|uniref:Amino acid/amide ABC transporter substrate-binding protein (HAAT family) n=1 Tax=Hydromonas duriensis TaxID=1527608 RepID=A0A4R6Y9B3_9BURK|nr:branched-chain amino acid ABC transporter substrate-binding protein [Hydromonas duriensis]TDR32027.1 amino acid/amide ABC transporter substrate-binding protein (HAAT family) [Hydromonas duriensis]
MQTKLFKLVPLMAAVALTACKPEEKKADAAQPAASGDTIVVKIGSGAPKSGEIAHLGKDNENGAQLAVNEINAKGDLVIGGKKVKLELVGEDDAGDPKQGPVVAQKLVDAGAVAVVGHLNSGVSIPASAVYAAAGMVQVSPSSTNPDYTLKSTKTPKGSVSAYRVVATDAKQGPSVAKYLMEHGAKKVVVLDDATQYGKGLADQVDKTLKEGKVEVVAREAATDKTTDFKAILTKIKAMNPDYIFWGGMDATAAPLVKQMKELGLTAKLASADGACTEKMVELAGEASEGVVCSVAGMPLEKMAKGKDFVANYEKAFSGQKVQIYSPFAYDAVYAIVDAMKKANSVDREAIAAAMPKVSIEGLIGKIEFEPTGDIKGGAITINEIKGKKLTVAQIIQ